MGWRKEAPYDDESDFSDDLVNLGCLPWPVFALVLAAVALVQWI